MAQNTQKTSSSRSSGGKKTAPKAKAADQTAARRQIAGAVCLFAAFLMVLSFFNIDGFVLRFVKNTGKGLLGAGFFVLPFSLLAAGGILLLKPKKKKTAAIVLILILPLLLGMTAHVMTSGRKLPLNDIKSFYINGQTLKSGGALAGYLSSLISKAISPLGTGVLCGLLLVGDLAILFKVNPLSALAKIDLSAYFERKRRKREERARLREEQYEEEEIEEQPLRPAKGRRVMDIPLDGENRPKKQKGELIEMAPPNVSTPAEVLARQKGISKPQKNEEKSSYSNDTGLDYDGPILRDGLVMAAQSAIDREKKAYTERNFEMEMPDIEEFSEDDLFAAENEAYYDGGRMDSIEEKADDAPPFDMPHKTESPSQFYVGTPVGEEKADDSPLADRFDAVKAGGSPIEIKPRESVDTAFVPKPSVSPSGTVSSQPKQAENVPYSDKNDAEIAAMVEKHNAEEKKEYLYPPISLLKRIDKSGEDDGGETRMLAERLVDTLLSFGVDSKVIGVTKGPTVTRYELVLQRGTKFSRVSSLSEDIALALGAPSIRISTIPDKLAVGIEVPNRHQQTVTIREIIDSPEFKNHKSKICFPVGRDIANAKIVGDIGKMPHMLIAGTTGSGKSVCINSILISLLYKSSPEEVRLIMIDPKMIELGVYNGIPHLLIPVVTDPKKASGALNWAVGEMMRRYRLLSEMGVRDLASYNDEVRSRGEGEILPQIVIVIDELADLMFVAAKEVEEAIARIAQMARAAGMHLIIATQRPSADIITGIMKANIPSRVAFAVASQIESRIILDTPGAEKLIGKGDMLYAPLGVSKPMRVQGCFITTEEVEAVVEFIKRTSDADYKEDIIEHIENTAENAGKGTGAQSDAYDDSEDPLMDEAIKIVVETGQASTSMLQRKLKLGYSRASRLIDQMEERGIVGPFEGSKARKVNISRQDWQEMMLRKNGE